MRGVHLGFAFILSYLMFPGFRWIPNKRVRTALDVVMSLAVAAVFAHLIIVFAWPDVTRLVNPSPIDIAVGTTALGLVVFVNWRVSGLPLALTAASFFGYMWAGDLIPGIWGHSGTYSLPRVISTLFLRLDTGILGVATSASATLIYPVLLFGATLVAFGAGNFLSEFSAAALGHVRGSSAKIAVTASAGFATVTGTGPANVATTGVFTIPLMKRAGYSPHFAASVEATASIGGQLLPPVMGAGAFVMAEFLGIPYSQVITHAFVPAILYFVGLFLAVDLRAAKRGLQGEPRKDRTGPSASEIFRREWHYPIPVLYMLYVIVIQQGSVGRAAVQASFLMVILDLVRRARSRRPLELSRLVVTCVETAKGAAFVGAAVAAVMIVISVLGLTGVGLRLSSQLISIAGGSLFLLLVMTAVASILLGAGLPVVATYLVLALITAPAISQLGVPLVAAHFFVFYLGVLGDLSPPTALAPTIAAGIAEASLLRTMMTSMLLAAFGFFLPFMFVYSPELLLIGDLRAISSVLSLAGASGAVVCFIVALEGYFLGPIGNWMRALFFIAVGLMVAPPAGLTAAGLGLGLFCLGLRYLFARRAAAEPATS